MNLIKRFNATSAPASTLLIRLMVGSVFLTEGILKFLYPDALGAGRFSKIGLPHAQILGPLVAGVEVVGGALVILGLLTRFAAFALAINISVAIVSTKIPILLGHPLGPFPLASVPHYGFLGMMHEARTDFSMLLGGLFLLIVGAGPLSFDARLAKGQTQNPKERTTTS